MARISKAAVANALMQPLRIEAAADLTAVRPTTNPAPVAIAPLLSTELPLPAVQRTPFAK